MTSMLYNGQNITLISPRRLGKTGLIWNTFHHIKSENKDAICISHNIHFIFSWSRKHLMSEMFASPKRPFYQSTDMMNLTLLDEETYYQFANRFFEAKKGGLDREVFRELYDIYDGYTWYIQSVLNRLYEKFKTVDSSAQLRETILNVVESKSHQYESIVSFLTDNQFSLLRAVAKEGMVEKPMSKEFIKKYSLPSASSVKTALEVLNDKELLYQTPNGYIVYDREVTAYSCPFNAPFTLWPSYSFGRGEKGNSRATVEQCSTDCQP